MCPSGTIWIFDDVRFRTRMQIDVVRLRPMQPDVCWPVEGVGRGLRDARCCRSSRLIGIPDKEEEMRKLCMTLIATLAVMGAMTGVRSHAAVIDPNALRTAADELAAVETVGFFWGGRRYCWYPTGWRGPGWYQCGFRWRRGFGWGGPLGWRGWRRPGVHRPGINRPNRPGINRPGANRP